MRQEIYKIVKRRFRDVHRRLVDTEASFYNSRVGAQIFRYALHVPDY